MNKIILAIIAVLVIGLGVWYATTMRTGGEAVARVNGEEITRKDFENLKSQVVAQQQINVASLDAATRAELDNQVVETLISQALLRQAVANSGVTVTSEDRDREIANIRGQFADDAAFQQALAAQGLTEAVLMTEVTNELVTRAYLNQKLNLSSVTATDAEVNTAYEQIASGQEVPPLEEVRDDVRALVVQQKQQQLILAYVEELRAGAEVEILI
jgi:parvulin-like peptidyl-prolyl isomerase